MERGSFEETLAALEDVILVYMTETNSRLSDDFKIVVLMHKTRGQLQEHLRLNAASLTRYHDVKNLVTNCIKTKQTFNQGPSKDPDAMEIGTRIQKDKAKAEGKTEQSQ